MSVPAGKPRVAAVPVRRVPVRHVPARPAPSPPSPERSTRASSSSRRRRHHLGFFVLSAFVVGSMVLAIVSLNVLLAQTSFRVDAAQERIDRLARERVDLIRQQATLSAPGRIAAWARRHDMRLPDDIRSLHVPSTTQAAPAGVADASTSGGP